MYVVKFSIEGFFYRVNIFKKVWSEDLMSNEIIHIDNKRFILHFLANYWVAKRMISLLINQKEMEIIDG